MQYANIHTHTTFSDGKNTPEEMVQKAIELGFSSIGISDHSETDFDLSYCMVSSDYEDYRKTVGGLKEVYGDRIDVFCGIEQDFHSSFSCDGFDYAIGSVHYILSEGEYFPVDISLNKQMDHIERHFGGDKMEYARFYYDTVAESAIRGGFEVLGHFDLVNKFGLFSDSTEAYKTIALQTLDTVLAQIPYIEMNTGAISRGYSTVYPNDFLLRYIHKKGGRIVLNGDSHSAAFLDSHFEKSLAVLKEIGFSSVWQLRKRGWIEVMI